MKISEFIFAKGKVVSLYGKSGSGKTSVSLQLCKEITPCLYISTEGVAYQARVEKTLYPNTYFAEAETSIQVVELIYSALTKTNVNLIVIDTVNSIYRRNREVKDLLFQLINAKEVSNYYNIRFLLTWQVSMNNRVSGEVFMRFFSDDILRITGKYIIGNLRECKIRINDKGVSGCL
ncbi:MAG: AAA family ATPase [Sulfolobaceae archaeon]|nr:AAA family ATPase [Sulfolobaceae archaeon]